MRFLQSIEHDLHAAAQDDAREGAADVRHFDQERSYEETPRRVLYRETSAITYTGMMLWKLAKAEAKNCRRLRFTGKTWAVSMRDAWVTYRVGAEARAAYWGEVCR